MKHLFTSGAGNVGVLAKKNKPVLDRKWYYKQLAAVVLGETKMTGTQMSALNTLARAKGWNKPKIVNRGMPKQLRVSQPPGVTDSLAQRLQNG